MIESLTKAQEKKLKVYRDKWIKIGLATGKANRKRVEKACREAYKAGGLKPPKLILWAESPLGLLMTAKLIKEIAAKGYKPYSDMDLASVRASVRDSVGASVWDSVRDSVRDSVGASVRASVWDSVRDSVRASVWASVGDSVWDSVRASVRDSVGASVRDSVWDSVRDSVRASVWDSVRDSVGASVRDSVRDSALKDEWSECNSWGQHDAGWLSFYNYFLEVCDLKVCKKLLPLMTLAEETGWHLFYANVAILSERPTKIHRNKEGRLHNFNGPALEWADGYKLYRFNGVRLDGKECFADNKIFDKDAFLKEENADVRREIIRKFGIAKVIDALGAEVIDTFKTKTGGTYELLSIDYDKRGKRPYLKMRDSSCGEVFILGTKPGITKAIDAWKFLNNGLDPEQTTIAWEA